MNQTTPPRSSLRDDAFLFMVFFAIFAVLALIFAEAFGKLSGQLAALLSGLAGFVVVITTIVSAFFASDGREFIRGAFGRGRWQLMAPLGCLSALVIVLVFVRVAAPPVSLGSAAPVTTPGSSQAPASARPTMPPPTLAPTTAPAVPSPTDTVAPVSTNTTAHQLTLQQTAPNCSNEPRADWVILNPNATDLKCTPSGTLIQQISPNNYAEVDLNAIDGGAYSQTSFHTQVAVHFLDVNDAATFGALLVQAPQGANAFGGYMLEIDPAGFWQLEQTITATQINTLDSGTLSIDPTQPTVLAITVQNQQLQAYVNGTLKAHTSDYLSPSPGAFGLLVKCDHHVSSQVVFSNFSYAEI